MWRHIVEAILSFAIIFSTISLFYNLNSLAKYEKRNRAKDPDQED